MVSCIKFKCIPSGLWSPPETRVWIKIISLSLSLSKKNPRGQGLKFECPISPCAHFLYLFYSDDECLLLKNDGLWRTCKQNSTISGSKVLPLFFSLSPPLLFHSFSSRGGSWGASQTWGPSDPERDTVVRGKHDKPLHGASGTAWDADRDRRLVLFIGGHHHASMVFTFHWTKWHGELRTRALGGLRDPGRWQWVSPLWYYPRPRSQVYAGPCSDVCFGCHMSSRTSPQHPCHESDQLL